MNNFLRLCLLRASTLAASMRTASSITSGSILDIGVPSGGLQSALRRDVAAAERAHQRDIERERARLQIALDAQVRKQRVFSGKDVEICRQAAFVAVVLD